MSYFLMYLIVMIGSIRTCFFVLGFIFLLVTFVSYILCADVNGKIKNNAKIVKNLIKGGIFGIFLMVLGFLTPNTKELAAIYIIPTVVNNEKVQNLGNDVYQILKEQTDQWLNDMKIKKEKK